MKLSNRTLTALAEMICGAPGSGSFAWKQFPYRSSSFLTEFFANCDLDYVHDGSTRKWWVLEVLEELNNAPTTNQALPSEPIVRVIQELLDPLEFQSADLDREAALDELNVALGRDGLQAYFDGAGRCHVRSVATDESSAGLAPLRRALTKEELEARGKLDEYFEEASEDDFTEEVLVPLFRQLGFFRVAVAGHRDRPWNTGRMFG